MSVSGLVIGIDGGGSKTLAWLADATFSYGAAPLGVGEAGPSNPQSIGWETALENMGRAVDTAFIAAGYPPCKIAAACVAMAGSDRENARRRLNEWSAGRELTDRFLPVHDAAALLAAGTPDGYGVAIISGTGSLAFGHSESGKTARSGGWGYLFGDEGSGYAVAIAGLRAVASAADGRTAATLLTDRFLQELAITSPTEMVQAVYARQDDRTWLSSLSQIVVSAANEGDVVAQSILEGAADALAEQVTAVTRSLGMDAEKYPLAIGGGLLVQAASLRERLITRLQQHESHPDPVTVVSHPVAGAVILARNLVTAAKAANPAD